MYSLDTSAFMDWHDRHYPVEVFPSLQARLVALISSGAGQAVQLVQEEIDAVGTPSLRAWAKSQAGLFVPLIPEIQIEAAAIEAAYPELMDHKGIHESADAYVIALAKLNIGGIVVSQETSALEKRKPKGKYIPDVCRDLGIPCINLLGLMRRERWVF